MVGVLQCLLALALVSCDRLGSRSEFSGDKALGYVREQLAFGPRVPGTEGHRRTGDWIVQMMRQRSDTVIEQRWTHVTAAGDSLPMRNIFARVRPNMPNRILYLAHWDTRPVSDEATDSADRVIPVPGANDGASAVAMLIALAEALKQTAPAYGVDFLFVDGEDYGDFDKRQDVVIGSTYFARNPIVPDYRPLYGVLWDMIGDRELQIFQEGYSVRQAPEIVARVWGVAADLGHQDIFVPRGGYDVFDDHVPLLQAGLRVINVIDIDYDCCHHRPTDTIDRVSAASLQVVGEVALALLTR